MWGILTLLQAMTGVWAMTAEDVDVITMYARQKHSVSAVIFTTFEQSDARRLAELSSSRSIHFMLKSPSHTTNVTDLLQPSYYPVIVVLYPDCLHIMKQACDERLLWPLHHWLLLDWNTSSLENFFLPLDSHITVAKRDSESDGLFLRDVYHVHRSQPLTVTRPRYWLPSLQLPPEPSRTNYGGIPLPTVVVLAQGTWEDFTDFRYRHINTESKVQYTLMQSISDMLNFRMNVCLTNTWGYPINGSRCFNGAVGMLQCGDCEIGATGLLFKTERMAVIDYAGETLTFRGAFMFLKPSLSEVSIIYELPFSTSVWITYLMTVTILTVVLMFTRRISQKASSSTEPPVSWSDTVMDSLAVVCQQDALHPPKNVSSRIVFIFMLILTVFLVTSYSAIIVSLLQTSSNAINTLTDLMKSPLKLSMIDIFVNETTDPEVTRVFKEKLYTQPFKDAFTTEEVGIEKIRHGLYAYHGLSGSYKVISDTYQDHEKCRFKEINMFTSLHLAFTARKSSPYISHIKERTCWLREVGLVDREDKRWFYQKPKCESAVQHFVSVGLQDFYPALVVLAYGIGGSVCLLIVEIVHRKYQAPGYEYYK